MLFRSLSTLVDVAIEKEEVAGNDPGTGPLFRMLVLILLK